MHEPIIGVVVVAKPQATIARVFSAVARPSPPLGIACNDDAIGRDLVRRQGSRLNLGVAVRWLARWFMRPLAVWTTSGLKKESAVAFGLERESNDVGR
ncbi:hypothetical protein ACSQ67_022781 [Phaseolus vulgaris]